MTKKLLSCLGLLSASLLATTAHAQSDEVRWPNWYVGLNGAVNWYPDSDVELAGIGTGEVSHNPGWMGSIALGYLPRTTMPVFNAMRLELEYAYRTNEVDNISGIGVVDTKTETHAVMGNVYFDFANQTRLTPYVGGGLGWANLGVEASGDSYDDDVFAWQLMAGLSYEPESMPMTVWNIGYRYFATTDAEYTTILARTEQEYSTHGLEVGAKFRF